MQFDSRALLIDFRLDLLRISYFQLFGLQNSSEQNRFNSFDLMPGYSSVTCVKVPTTSQYDGSKLDSKIN